MNAIRKMTFITRLVHAAALLTAAAFSSIASAQLQSVFEIAPAIAGPGIERQISVTVPAAVGCLPNGRVVSSIDTARKRTLTISLDMPLPANVPGLIVCTGALIFHKVTVNYTPQEEGDLRLLAVGNVGSFYGEALLRTRADVSKRSQYDLTGMWYDPATNGSGVTFVHGATKNDQVFGTWYVYDNAGNPRWYTIQNVQWNTGGMEAQGQLYETRANSIVCVPPYTGCPVALALASAAGVVSIVMQGPNSARITAVSAGGTMTSNLIRSIF
ncbi:MAG: hypothetical protein JNN20_16165 [Betaproteobacteria bacterium]|nr:hypothetical protein [Betaproteobacteria bacterium]